MVAAARRGYQRGVVSAPRPASIHVNIVHRILRLPSVLAFFAACGLFAQARAQTAYTAPSSNRVDLNFNYDWKFYKGTPAGPTTPQAVGFDDSKWTAVSLPHTWNDLDRYREWIATNAQDNRQPAGDYPDAAWGQAPAADPVLGTSGAYYGVGWYRKHFTLDASYAGRKVIAEFSGISRCAHFYVNGQDVAYLPGTTTANTIQLPAITGINGDTTLPAETLNCGYHENGIGPCGVDLTPYLNPAGQDNLIAVWVTNDFNYVTQEYGVSLPYGQPFNLNFGGLQRDAVLHVADPLYQTLPLYRNLGTVGTYAYTANVDTLNRTADLTVTSEVKNDYTVDKTATMDTVLVDAGGNQVGTTVTTAAQTVKAGTKATFTSAASLTGVHLWDTTYPYLYQVYTVLKVGGTVVDVNKIPLGVHKWKFGSTIGLELNGHPIYLNGYAPRTTMEWPAVGIPPDWMVEYDFNLIKQSGGNFVRPMHSAPRKIQVDAADKLGVVMVCPATATENDETVAINWTQKVADMRDVCVYFRNNPSVYFWEGNNGDLSATHMQNMMDVTAQFDPGNVDITPGRDYRDNTRLIGTRAAGTGADAAQRQYSSPIESNVRDANRPIWDAEYARGECPRRVWDNYTPMLNPFWDGKNPDPTPVQGSVATFGDTTHKYLVGGFGYISNLYYEQTAGDDPLDTTVPAGGSGINWDAGAGINDYLALIPNGTNSDGSTDYANGYYRLMNSEELMIENTAKYFGRYENSVFEQPAATSAASGVTVGGAKIIWADSVTDGRLKDVDVARVSGAVDGARLPKETFYGMRVAQNDVLGVPDIYVAGHWNYPAGTVKTVYVVSNTSQVKLQTYDASGNLIKDYGFGSNNFFPSQILSPGSDQVNKYVFAFNNVAFQPGYIQAQGYNDGSSAPVVQTSLTDALHPSLKTAGDPASIRITPITGPQGWLADGADIVMFDAEVIDANGQRCPTYEDKVTFTASAPATGTFLGGFNTGVRYSTNINHLTTYGLNIEAGINRVFARSTRTAGTFTLSATGTFVNAAGKTINLTSNLASVASTVFPVTNGLTATAPQKYTVALGTEPTPVAEGAAPPPPSNAPQPAPASNVQGLAYSGTHQNQAVLVENAQPGDKAYVDSNTITLPSTLPGYLIGGEYIQPFLADNNAAPATDQYQFNTSRYSYLYLMLDAADGIPNNDGNSGYQWTKQAETVTLNGRTMNIYKSVLEAPYAPVFLASNNYQNDAPGFDGKSNMYLVFIVSAEEQLQNPNDAITATSEQNTTTYKYSNAIDGDVTTHWNASSGSLPQVLTLTLPKPVNVGGYDINFPNGTKNPYKYLVEVSPDGNTWYKSLDQSANVTPGEYEYRVPAPLIQNSANVSQVRVTISATTGGNWAGITELKVNGVLASTADTQPPVITSSLSPVSGQGGYAITPYAITASGTVTGYAAQGLPPGLTVNGVSGVISGTPTAGGTFAATITAINGAGTGSAVLAFNIANPPPAPTITSTLTYPPSGTMIPAGSAITAADTYTATANPTQYTPLTFTATLPANLGLAFNTTTGKITGTPKYPGTYTIPLSATNPGGTGPVANLSYTVTPTGTPPSINSPATASAYLGTAYTATTGIYAITANGSPTLFGVSAPSGGTLPAWLKINTSTGVLYGTPDTLGNVPVVVSASNAGGTATANVTISVVRNPNAPVITSPLTASGHVNTAFSYTITASPSATSYSVTGLPAPLQLNGNVISGTPTATATNASVVLKAINSYGFDQQTLVLNIGPAVVKPVLSGPINAVGTVGAAFSCQYSATNTPTGYTFTAASGTTLPAWLQLDTVNGTLSGIPNATGTTTLTITAYNDGGTSNAVTLNIAVSAAGSDVNLALNKPVVTLNPAIAGNLSSYAVDGSTATRWESPHDDTEWIYVNLGAVYTIHAVVLNWQQGAVGKNYTVEISNTGADGSWTNYVPPITGNTAYGALTYTATAQAQYVRMNGTLRAGIYGYSLWEFAVMGQLPAASGVVAPTGLAAKAGSSAGQIALNWNAVSGAQKYTLQRSTSQGGSYATVGTVNAPATTFTDSDPNLAAGVTYYYEIAVTTSAGTSPFSAPAAGTPDVPPGIQGWRYQYFGPAGLNPTDTNGASDAANPAHDGINNLLKYALGMNPTVNYYTTGANSLPVVQKETVNGKQYLTLTFTGAVTDVTYTVQATSTLNGTWTTLATFSGAGALDTITVQDTQPTDASSARFMRLQVTGP